MSRWGRRVVAGMLALVTAVGLSACSPRSADWTETVAVLAAGSPTGVYHDYGSHLAAELSRELDVDLTAEVTAGSVDNLLRVSAGEALLGFAQGDAAADAVAGTGAFTEALDVQAIARLYDEYLQIVVRDDSALDDLADLSGRRISLGAENSGVNVIATRVLHAAGVAADADLRVETGLALADREDDHAHRVLARGVVRRLDGLLGDPVAGGDDEGQHATEGDGAALFTHLHELLGDLADGRVGDVDDHGRLQTRPSRARSSSAEAGPHEPGAYCSGWESRDAQYCSIGSRIFHDSSTSSWRGKSGGSPSRTSRMRRSYASGLASVNACP